jgi:hypothetical protein
MAYTASLHFTYSVAGTSSAAGYYFTATVTAVTDFADKNLFLLQMGKYAGVCTVIDLANVGLVEDPVSKFVRANNFTIWCKTYDERSSLKAAITSTVQNLCRDKANLIATNTETVTVSQ